MKKKIYFIFYLILCLVIIDKSIGYFPRFRTWNIFFNKLQPQLGKRNIRYLLREYDDNNFSRQSLHPYMLYGNTPNYINKQGVKEINNLGYRNSEDFDYNMDSSVHTIKILAIGGSTTWGYYIDSPDDTWPAKLELLLNQFYDEESIKVINAGILYGTSAELLSHYLYKNRYLRSDIVIIHTGGNDVAPLLFHDYNPDYSDFRNINFNLHSFRKGEHFLVKNSNIARSIYTSWLGDKLSLPHIKSDIKNFNLDPNYYLENIEANKPIGFTRNLNILIRNIIADNSVPILFPFYWIESDSALEEVSVKTNSSAAHHLNIREASKIGIKKHKKIMKNLSKKYQIPYFELDKGLIPSKDWFDHCHLKSEGENVKARFMFHNLKNQINHVISKRTN